MLVRPALLQVGRADPIGGQIITRTQAQTDPLIAEENAANDLYGGGKYQEALARLLRLAELVRSRFGENSANFARLLNAIGRSNAALGRTREAESFYRRALAIREQTL